jgi:hypothetical protein
MTLWKRYLKDTNLVGIKILLSFLTNKIQIHQQIEFTSLFQKKRLQFMLQYSIGTLKEPKD